MSAQKFGSLSKALGDKFSKLSSPRKTESPSFKNKKRDVSDELTNGLKKLSGNKEITSAHLEWINTFELHDKENLPSKRLEQLRKEKEKEKVPSSPGSPSRRAAYPKKAESVENEKPKSGKCYLRVAEVNHKVKQPKCESVMQCTVRVQDCLLSTSPVDFRSSVSFEEGFLFDIQGDFDVVLEVVYAPKEKGFHMPESLGTLTFSGLSVLPVAMLTGEYYLNKDGEDTSTSITLQLAIKLQEDEEVEREKLPEPDFVGTLSRQVSALTGGYRWVMNECEVRGRTLRFYDENTKVKTLTLDYRSKIEKKKETASGEMLPYHCFQIWVAGEPIFLTAQTKEEREQWIEELSRASNSAF